MTLASEAARIRRGPPCSIDLLLRTMAPADADELRTAMDDPLVYSTALARVLRKRGHEVGHYALQRHRRGDCSCHH